MARKALCLRGAVRRGAAVVKARRRAAAAAAAAGREAAATRGAPAGLTHLTCSIRGMLGVRKVSSWQGRRAVGVCSSTKRLWNDWTDVSWQDAGTGLTPCTAAGSAAGYAGKPPAIQGTPAHLLNLRHLNPSACAIIDPCIYKTACGSRCLQPDRNWWIH